MRAKIIGDSPPAASGANIRSLLLQGGRLLLSPALLQEELQGTANSRLLQEIQMGTGVCDSCNVCNGREFMCCTQHPRECRTAIISVIAQTKWLQV